MPCRSAFFSSVPCPSCLAPASCMRGTLYRHIPYEQLQYHFYSTIEGPGMGCMPQINISFVGEPCTQVAALGCEPGALR